MALFLVIRGQPYHTERHMLEKVVYVADPDSSQSRIRISITHTKYMYNSKYYDLKNLDLQHSLRSIRHQIYSIRSIWSIIQLIMNNRIDFRGIFDLWIRIQPFGNDGSGPAGLKGRNKPLGCCCRYIIGNMVLISDGNSEHVAHA